MGGNLLEMGTTERKENQDDPWVARRGNKRKCVAESEREYASELDRDWILTRKTMWNAWMGSFDIQKYTYVSAGE